jgi:NADPH2:quinone reductase
MLMKRLRVIGSTLRARPVAAKEVIMNELRDRVWPLIESGDIVPIVEEVIPIADTGRAHELIASDSTFGKVILAVD